MKILIGNAWPYANGPLHIGHIAALLPGDVLARYHRAKGDAVTFVSGSDCHGTPVTLRAHQEGKSPQVLCETYHAQFRAAFERLGFQFDLYGKTFSPAHKDFVLAFHRRLYQSAYVYERETLQAYCPSCERFLADRFVLGACPECGEDARGDQCEACGAVLEPEQLARPRCALCGQAPAFRPTRHLFLALSRLADALADFAQARPDWRRNAAAFTRRYLAEGLRDRAITRDLDWGVEVPRAGYGDKRIYIWAENVLGYLSMSRAVADGRGNGFEALWTQEDPDVRHYYVHGKDNIPVHTIILPALLLAHGGGWHLPDRIVSSEYLTLEGRKISTSQGWAIWAEDLAARFDPDSIRYFLITNGPEKRDTDFSFREFVNSHNGELLGAYGNFIHRTLVFVRKYLGGRVPECAPDEAPLSEAECLYAHVGKLLEQARFKEALDAVFALVRSCNRYFDHCRPWETRTSDPAACARTLGTCVQLAANLAVLLGPFLPFSSAKVRLWLNVSETWAFQRCPGGLAVPEPSILFARIERDQAAAARALLLPGGDGAEAYS